MVATPAVPMRERPKWLGPWVLEVCAPWRRQWMRPRLGFGGVVYVYGPQLFDLGECAIGGGGSDADR